MKTDPTVIKETKYITIWVVIFSTLMEAVFLILHKWDYTVLLGNLLGGGVAVLNFFLLGRTIQKAMEKHADDVKNYAKLSQTGRFLMIIAAAALGAALPCFNLWATVISIVFPRIAIAIRPIFIKNEEQKGSDSIG